VVVRDNWWVHAARIRRTQCDTKCCSFSQEFANGRSASASRTASARGLGGVLLVEAWAEPPDADATAASVG
jgi:hypothetical protein